MDRITSPHEPAMPGWIPVGTGLPQPHHALVYKMEVATGTSPVNWMGSVLGLYSGKQVCVLVMCNESTTILAPMVEDGVDLRQHLTHWAPWPKAVMPLPPSAMAAVVAPAIDLPSDLPGIHPGDHTADLPQEFPALH